MTKVYRKPVFVFSGIGTQWPGMGSDLLESVPAFRKGVANFDNAFSSLSGISPLALIRDKTDIAVAAKGHPCVLAVEIGLYSLLRERNVEPFAVIGHSGGEVAAAYVSGALSIEDAALVAWGHSRILEKVAGKGSMAHVSLPPEKITSYLVKFPDVAIVVENSPEATVIAGPASSVNAIIDEISSATGVFCRLLKIDSPLHSHAVEPFLDDFERSLSGLNPSPPTIPIFSSLRGGLAHKGDFDALYWRDHIRRPVAFASAVEAALSAGAESFVEISPHAVLQDAFIDCARASGRTIITTALMRRDEPAAPVIDEAFSLLEMNDNVQAASSADSPLSNEARLIVKAEAAERRTMISALIADCLKDVSEGAITPSAHEPFVVMGVTSLMAVMLRNAICSRLGLNIPATVIFSYPTIPLLCDYIGTLLERGSAASAASTAPSRGTGRKEPLAIVGFSCRLPGGVNDPESLWTLVRDGIDAVSTVPPDRWDADRYYDPDPDAPGMSRTKEGGFLNCPIDMFDAPFFGISAREARQLDPQQRLLLEVMWEAFEHAGIDITRLQGSRTGIFLGMSSMDYSHAHRDSYRRELIDAYSLTGTTFSGAAGRLAYLYDFQGPCFTVDTACSSSLVALHCACRSLREGESDAAVVGGVNLMLVPDLHVAFTKLGAVSPDGRSKAFDDGADGYGRGEGCVMLVLKRLSDAERDGDTIMAVVRGTATNQDGKSNGLTAPNGLAQMRVIADALSDAELNPGDISYVEAHGTGTALGDSIEIQSLAEAYCSGRDNDNPLMVGSIKANVGHLEPAAAVTGIAKIICAMKHREIPANIHIKTPNTRFEWHRYPILAPTVLTPWETKNEIRRAGISAFGFSGTNSHAIIEEYVPKPYSAPEPSAPSAFMLPVSAKSPESLTALRKRHTDAVVNLSDSDLASYCFTALSGRAHHRWRMAVSGSDGQSVADALRNAAPPVEPSGTPSIAMFFTGQGSQYPDMGKALYECFPAFADAIDECAHILKRHDIDLLHLLYGGSKADELEHTGNAQPVIASVEYALWKLWSAWGVKPDVVAGHSIGEYPAAVAAGIMSVSDMLALVAARSKAMGEAPPNGSMAAVFASETIVKKKLNGREGVVIAAVNAPEAVSISGVTEKVEAVCEDLAKDGIKSKVLRVSHAFHSPLMNAAAEKFGHALKGITFELPKGAAFVSTVSGHDETYDVTQREYWIHQITRPVRFADAVAHIAETCGIALEAGGTAALSGLIAQSVSGKITCVSSLSPKADAVSTMFEAAARLYAAGVDIDGDGMYSPFHCKKASLPTYQFDRKSYWMHVHTEPPAGSASESHPVLGIRLDSPALNDAEVFETVFDDKSPDFLHEHIIYGKPISPGAGHLAMLFAAAKEVWGSPVAELRDINFLAPLVVPGETRRRVQVIFDTTKGEKTSFRLVSRAEDSNEWTVHCTGTLTRTTGPEPDTSGMLTREVPAMQPIAKEDFYSTFVNAGYDIGKGFQRIEEIKSGDGEALCRVSVRLGNASERGHVVYPGAVDSILQTGLPGFINTFMEELLTDGATIVPMHIDRVALWRDFPDEVICRSWVNRVAETLVSFRILAMNHEGKPVMEMDGLMMQKTDRQTLYRSLNADASEWLYTREWIDTPPPDGKETGQVIVIGCGSGNLAKMIHARRGGLLLGAGDVHSNSEAIASAVGKGLKTVVVAYDRDGAESGSKTDIDPTGDAVDACMTFVETAKYIIKKELNAVLWTVTVNSSGPDSDMPGLAGSSLWGAAMSLTAEEPQRAGGILDTDLSGESLSLLTDVIGRANDRPFGAIRKGQFKSLRLARTPARHAMPPVRSDGSYLITGGSGALGRTVAQWLAEKGAGTIVLVSRGGVGRDHAEELDVIRSAGCRIEDIRCDVSNSDDVSGLIRHIDDTLPPLAGIFHAAGVLDDATIPEMSHEKFVRVMEPKVRGAMHLHQAAEGKNLDWFVLFSSAASLLGSGGQSNYAAANMMLNELAVSRAESGLPALSICWGPWAGGGMAGSDAKRGARLAANGILELAPDKALMALEKAAATGKPVVGVMAMDWDIFIGSRTALHGDYLSAFGVSQIQDKSSDNAGKSALGQILSEYVPDHRDRLEEALCSIAAQTLGFSDTSRIETRQPLMEQGFDSLMAVEIRNRLMKETGADLPASFLFSNPTIEKIAGWFVDNTVKKTDVAEHDITNILGEIDSLLE